MTGPTAIEGGTPPQWTSEVSIAEPSPEAIGFTIDRPAIGEVGPGWSLTVAGWVAGRHSPAREVHVLLDGALVRRAPIDVERVDVDGRLGLGPERRACGFWTHVGVLGLPRVARLEVTAVLEDGTHVHLGSIVVTHRSLESGYDPLLQPVLVTSLGRMGTTWLMRILAVHPEAVVHDDYPYELGVARYWAHLLSVASGPADHLDSCEPDGFTGFPHWVGHNPYFGDFLWQAPDLGDWLATAYPTMLGGTIQRAIDGFYGQVATRQGKPSARIAVEKSLPDGVPDVVGDLYPRSRELVLVRDIRDVICSVVAFDIKRGRRSFGREHVDDQEFVTQLRVDLEHLVRGWRRRQDRALLVRYESLVTEPVATLTEVLTHLELDATPDVVRRVLEQASVPTPELEAHRTSTSVSESLGRWRTELVQGDPQILELCNELFDPLLEELGYPTSRSHRRARSLQRSLEALLGDAVGFPATPAGAVAASEP